MAESKFYRRFFVIGAFLILAASPGRSLGQVTVSEVMFDPATNEAHDEYVEIFNLSATDSVNLAGWAVGDSIELDKIIDAGWGLILRPRQFAVILDGSYFGNSTTYDGVIPAEALIVKIDDGAFGSGGWSNTIPEPVILTNARGDTVSRYRYTLDNPQGYSDEKIDLEAGDAPANWANSRVLGGTPGAPNSVSAGAIDLALKSVVWSPSRVRRGQSVQLTVVALNAGRKEIASCQIALYLDRDEDGFGREEELLEAPFVSPSLQPGDSAVARFTWHEVPAGVHQLLARVVGEGDSSAENDQQRVTLGVGVWPGEVVVNEVMYRPSAGEPEWVEILNRSPEVIDLRLWSLSDSRTATRVTVTSTKALLPPGGFALLAEDTLVRALFPTLSGPVFVPGRGWPALNNTSDAVVIWDAAGFSVDSLYYFASWGGETGVSIERVRPDWPTNSRKNWGPCRAPLGGTPNAPNSIRPRDKHVGLGSAGVQFEPPQPRYGQTVRASVWVYNHGMDTAESGMVAFYRDADYDLKPGAQELVGLSCPLAGLAGGDSLLCSVELGAAAPGLSRIIARLVEVADPDTSDDMAYGEYRVPFQSGDLIINEIMFQPQSGACEWIELFNPRDSGVDVYDWTVSDENVGTLVRLTDRHIVVPPGGYLVVAKDTTMKRDFPEFGGLLLTIGSKWPTLNNDADLVVVRDLTGATIDSVAYAASWGPVRTGVSLERVRAEEPSNLPSNWRAAVNARGGTPGLENSVSPLAVDVEVVAGSIQWAPFVPRAQGSVTIAAAVRNVGRQAVAGVEVSCYWDADGDSVLTAAERLDAPQVVGELASGAKQTLLFRWEGVPPGVHSIAVAASCPNDQRPDNDRRFAELVVAFPVGQVLVNEIMYAPFSGQSEWVELYNAGPSEVDLYGWGLGDATSGPRLFGTTHVRVPVGGFAVVAADSVVRFQYGQLPAPLLTVKQGWAALNNDQDEVRVYDPAGVVVDSVHYFSRWGMRTGVSLERVRYEWGSQDSANWRLSTAPEGATPGTENSVSPLTVDVGVAGAGLSFLPEQPRVGESVRLQAQVCNEGRAPAEHVRVEFFWDANRDTVFAPGERLGEPVDIAQLAPDECRSVEVEWREAPAGVMWIGVLVTCAGDMRPANNIAVAELMVGFARGTLVVNEIMYAPLSGMGEWVELYNRSEAAVNLEKWLFSDADLAKRRVVSSNLLLVPPGGFVLLAEDSSLAKAGELGESLLLVVPSWPALSATGDAVVVYDPQGTVIDSVAYDQSWGGDTGVSLERINPSLPSQLKSNWSSCVDKTGGTPGRANSVLTMVVPPRTTLSVSPSPFSPDGDGRDDFAVISFALPMTTAAVNVKIYDVTGRLIRFLASNQPVAASNAVVWDGRDDHGQQARIGVYIVYLEALNAAAGTVETARATVVLAGRL
ncbi:MAG: lamin tail domain-containing protein [Calditrichaeota bacterium]|nr:lamin tail domain-containing protein [Calditrichota bacterium]